MSAPDFLQAEYNNGLLKLWFKEGVTVDLEEARVMTGFLEGLTNDDLFVSVSYAGKNVSWTKDARAYLAKSGKGNQLAAALISDSAPLRIMANFFMKFNKPAYPTKFFSSMKEGEAWVTEMKAQAGITKDTRPVVTD